MIGAIFLGTNGWYSTETGSTSCVLVDSDRYYIVFDAGDGIYKLDSYVTRHKPVHLFLSHFHLDHVSGFHIMSKLKLDQGIDIYGQRGTRRTLSRLVQHPFTVPLRDLPIDVRIHELSEGTHEVPFPVTCKFLLHADPCYGYRVCLDGKTIAYCTDTAVCDNSLELCKNADLLIHECASKSGHSATNWPHTNPPMPPSTSQRWRPLMEHLSGYSFLSSSCQVFKPPGLSGLQSSNLNPFSSNSLRQALTTLGS